MNYDYYYNEVMHHEWVISNNRGGYSMGSGNLINKKKYNGLLISSDKHLKRDHLVHSQEEKIRWRTKEIFLDSNNYPDSIFPHGYEHIVKTWFFPHPTFLFSSTPPSDDFIILKSIKIHPSKNAVKIEFTNHSSHSVELTIRPKFSLRGHHSVNIPGTWDNTEVRTMIENNKLSILRPDNSLTAFSSVSKGIFEKDTVIFRKVFYPDDSSRGYDPFEDLISPVIWNFKLNRGESAFIIYSDNPVKDINRISGEIDRNYKNRPIPLDNPSKDRSRFSISDIDLSDNYQFREKDYLKLLRSVFDTFLLKDDIIAGFPWFSCWGRDTLISMKPLLFKKDGIDLYIKILKKYGRKINNGIIPNVIGEGGIGTNYDSVDASLWYGVRSAECWDLIKDIKTKKLIFKYLTNIVGNYLLNPMLPFRTADDGLIEIKTSEKALTWMDAKVYNKPVTPRKGKPVEINALWYNTLRGFKRSAEELGRKHFRLKGINFDLEIINDLIKNVEDGSQSYVVSGHLADRIENGSIIDEYRPNSLIAVSLPFKLWNDEIIRNTWELAERELYTPYGLRTLSPRNPSFKKKFIGDQVQLDLAYHQGTVWAWLLGPFVETFRHINKNIMDHEELAKKADSYIEKFKHGLLKGHISSVAEVWDGYEPHFPKGCPAQAWSAAALLNIHHLTQGDK